MRGLLLGSIQGTLQQRRPALLLISRVRRFPLLLAHHLVLELQQRVYVLLDFVRDLRRRWRFDGPRSSIAQVDVPEKRARGTALLSNDASIYLRPAEAADFSELVCVILAIEGPQTDQQSFRPAGRRVAVVTKNFPLTLDVGAQLLRVLGLLGALVGLNLSRIARGLLRLQNIFRDDLKDAVLA